MHHTMKTITACCGLLAFILTVPWPSVSALTREQVGMQNLLTRWYELGERVSYRMTATTKDRTGTATYAATAKGVVKRDDMGRLFEELEWPELVWNGTPVQIPPANQQFRQILSLSPDRMLAAPDVSRALPRLVALTFDLRSFYADAWAAMQQPTLRFTGNHTVVLNHGDTNSWADGARVILGEDSTDLEITLDDVNLNEGTATLTVLHVPPAQPKITLPAEWMRTRVADAPNNWVQVVRAGARQFVASIGAETSKVEMQLSLTNGKIFSARMENPVEVFERECTDEALTMCGEGTRYQLLRQIAISE
jgi:hypothetical protein